MGWRTVVVSKSSKLDLRLGYMVVAMPKVPFACI